MMEGIGQPGQRHLTATEKVWRVRRVLCSSYNMSTLFRNLQKWCLAEIPTMVHGQTICQTGYGLITSLKYCHIFLPVPIKVLKDPDLLASVIVFYELMNTVLLKRQKNHVRVTIWKTLMHDCIISLRVEVMAHKTSLTLMLFIEYQERRVIIYVHLYRFYLCFHDFLGTVWIVWYFMCSSLLPV